MLTGPLLRSTWACRAPIVGERSKADSLVEQPADEGQAPKLPEGPHLSNLTFDGHAANGMLLRIPPPDRLPNFWLGRPRLGNRPWAGPGLGNRPWVRKTRRQGDDHGGDGNDYSPHVCAELRRHLHRAAVGPGPASSPELIKGAHTDNDAERPLGAQCSRRPLEETYCTGAGLARNLGDVAEAAPPGDATSSRCAGLNPSVTVASPAFGITATAQAERHRGAEDGDNDNDGMGGTILNADSPTAADGAAAASATSRVGQPTVVESNDDGSDVAHDCMEGHAWPVGRLVGLMPSKQARKRDKTCAYFV